MLFTWIDGHLFLAGMLCFPAAYLLILLANARLVRRVEQRREIFTSRGDR